MLIQAPAPGIVPLGLACAAYSLVGMLIAAPMCRWSLRPSPASA
jgi:hypothetical protein